MGASWTSEKSARFLYRGWENEAVAYDTLTGDTHLLEPLAAELLLHLDRGEQTLQSLAQHLSGCFSFPAEDDILAITESTLKRLESIGIAVAVSH
jgi:PqqD family protein of HPr-rel-A system